MRINYRNILKRIQSSAYVVRLATFFLLLSSTSTLILGVYLSIIRMNIFSDFEMAIVGGIIGSSFALATVLLIDMFEKIKCYIRYRIIDFRVCQQRSIVIHGGYEEIVSRLSNTLARLKGTNITKKDVKGGIVKAETKRSWRSFGENLELKLFNAHGKVTIVLTSQPRRSTTLFDFSKNLENLELIVRGLKKEEKGLREGSEIK